MFFHFFAEEDMIKALKEKGLRWQELHFYMPHYGLYVPEEKEWPNLITMEYPHVEAQIEIKDPSNPGAMVSEKKIKDYVAMLRKHGVATYIYINHQNCYIDYARKNFPESIVTKHDGSMHIGHVKNSLTIINSDPDLPWGRHIEEQGRKLIELYPEAEGLFVDNVGHWFLDFAHNDGISMVGERPVYATYLAYLPPLRKLREQGKRRSMSFYGNGPSHIDQARYLDGVMSEGTMSNGLRFLGLKKPVVCARPPASILESVCQLCLKYGTILDVVPSYLEDPEQASIAEAYQPFFEKLVVREWELTPHALHFRGSLDGNIYRVSDNEWVVALIHFGESILDADGSRAVRSDPDLVVDPAFATIEQESLKKKAVHAVTIRLPKDREIAQVVFQCRDGRRILDVERKDRDHEIAIPGFRGAAILQIAAES